MDLVPTDSEQRALALADVAYEAAACTRCDLALTRNLVVFGEGDPGARIMLIGEAPGRHEDETGRPFAGAAGVVLDSVLEAAGMDRSEVFITAAVKCRPPKNRDPKPEEMAACRHWLSAQLAMVRPDVIIGLGTYGTRALLGRTGPISKIRGEVHDVDGIVVVPTFHPAAVIYDPKKRDVLVSDLIAIRELAESRARERS